MKQHITKEQVNKLSNKAQRKLLNWWQPQMGEWFYHNENNKEMFISDCADYEYSESTESAILEVVKNYKFLPLLSIGQMIELLEENWNEVYIHFNHVTICWYIGSLNDKHPYSEEELCDALWEACKEVLEKEV